MPIAWLRRLFNRIVEDFQFLRRGTAGRRFRDFYQHKKEERGRQYWVFLATHLGIGLPLIVGGLAIGWLPGPGGFLAIIGLALVARVVPGVAKQMDRVEILGRRLWAWFNRRSIWLQLAAYAFAAAVTISSMIFITRSILRD